MNDSKEIMCISVADECKDKYSRRQEGICAQWTLLTLSVRFIAKESDIPSLSALLLLATEQDGRMVRKGKKESKKIKQMEIETSEQAVYRA